MAKVSLVFLVSCTVCALDLTLGLGYYLPTYPNTDDIYNYAPYSTILQPDCDNSKKEGVEEAKESSSSEENKEGGSKESSSEEKSSSEEGGSEKKEVEGSEKNSEGESGESKGVSEENKKASLEMKPKEIKYIFPPPSYTVPETQMQQILYSPATSYSYLPYKSPYVVQQPLTSYPAGGSYQYFGLPSSTTVGKTYAMSSSVGKGYSSPVANYPGSSKTFLTPGIRVYSSPSAWNSPVGYYKI